jgi:Membrane protein involved in the export of O-antigen and teichoic acid
LRDTWWLVAQTSGAKIYWALATLLTAVITARWLGPEGRGVFVAAVAWVTLFSTFGHLSLGQVIIHVATTRQDDWLPEFVGSAIAILTAVAITGYLVIVTGYLATDGRMFNHLTPGVLAVAFIGLPFMLWIENGNGILMSIGRLPVMNLAQATGATATLLLTYVSLAFLGLHVRGALGATAFAQALTVMISAGYLLRRSRRLVVSREAVRRLLGGSAQLHLNTVGTFLFTQANVLILNQYRSSAETAQYQIAFQIVTGLQIIPLAVSAVAYSLVSKEGPDAAWPRHRRLLIEVVALVFAIIVVAYFAAPFAVSLAFGRGFAPAVPLLRIMLLGGIGMTISIVMASQWIARGLFLQAALITLGIGIATVVSNELLVPRYGMFGAAWVTVGTYTLTMCVNLGMAAWVESRCRSRIAE